MSYTQIKGLDASHWDLGELNMHEAKSNGISFWFEKASEGLSTDAKFAERQPRIRATFSVRGWYHFCHDTVDATQQGEHFANVIGPLQSHEYACFDVEIGWGSLTGEAGVNYLINIIEAYQAKSGSTDAQIVLYGSLGWLRGQFGSALSKLTRFHLWAARYAPALGNTSPWPMALIWQSDESASIPGVAEKSVDLDWWLDGHYPIG